MSFFSAMEGLSKGLNASLQRHEGYAQQAKFAKDARDQGLLDKRMLMKEQYQYDSALKRLGDDNSYNIPGFPFKLSNPESFKEPWMQSRNILKQVDAHLSRLTPEMQEQVLNNAQTSRFLQDHLSQAMEWQVIRGENQRVLGKTRWGAGTVVNDSFRKYISNLGYSVENRITAVDSETNQVEIVLNSASTDPTNPAYSFAKELVDGEFKPGTWDNWVKVNSKGGEFETRMPLPITITKKPGTGELNSSNSTFIKDFNDRIQLEQKLVIMRDDEKFQFFDRKNVLSRWFVQYMQAGHNSQQKRDIASHMMQILSNNTNEDSTQAQGNKSFTHHRDQFLVLSDAVALATGTKTTTRDGENVIERYKPENLLSEAHQRELVSSYQSAQSLNEQFDDAINTLMEIEALDLAGASIPLAISKKITTLFGVRGEDEKRGIEGIISGATKIFNSITGNNNSILLQNSDLGVNVRDPKGRFAFSQQTMDDLKAEKGIVQASYNAARLAGLDEYEDNLNISAEAGDEYFMGLSKKAKGTIKQFYLDALKTELTYKLAMAWQGGAGGRMVSDQDFKIIRHAIWGLPSGPAQAAAIQLVRMSSIRPMLRSHILARHNTPGKDPFEILQKLEPALQATYENAYGNFLNIIHGEGISEEDLEARYRKRLRAGSDVNIQEDTGQNGEVLDMSENSQGFPPISGNQTEEE